MAYIKLQNKDIFPLFFIKISLFIPAIIYRSLNRPEGNRLLHPLENVVHGDEVDVAVGGQDLVDPELQGVQHLGGASQPGGVHVQTKGSPK